MNKKHKNKKKTVGAHAVDRQQLTPETRDPIEIQRATEQGYINNLIECIKTNQVKYPGDFFVVVISKNEKLLYNVIRCYFFDRSTCPTPDYDQTVFRFNKEKEEAEHIWTIPDKETCLMYLANKDQVVNEEYPLLSNVLRFMNGDLYRLCKKLNKEEVDSNMLVI